MKTWEKVCTFGIALVGAGSGVWGAYTANKAIKLKQPLDVHAEMVKSYDGEIASAAARKDQPDVVRLQIEYETYEEQWRTLQRVSAIVAPITELRLAKLSSDQVSTLGGLIEQLSKAPAVTSPDPTIMGAAYLALDRYDSAARIFSPTFTDPRSLALKAAAFGGLANSTTDGNLRQAYMETARSSLNKSIQTSHGTSDQLAIIEFAQHTPSLVEYLPEAMQKKPQE
jgi:hypothetical protein